MIVKYNGEYTRETRAYGCSKCGTASSINGRAVYKTSDRTYYEGRLYIFNQGERVQVDSILGKYLLSRTYTDTDGVVKNAYSEALEEDIPLVVPSR